MNFYCITRFEKEYDEATAFVVRARDESHARQVVFDAQMKAKKDSGWSDYLDPNLWLDPKFASCELLPLDGEPEILLVDFFES